MSLPGCTAVSILFIWILEMLYRPDMRTLTQAYVYMHLLQTKMQVDWIVDTDRET